MGAVMPADLLIGDDFAEYMQATETEAKVVAATNYRDDLLAAMFSPSTTRHANLPWSKTFDQVQFRPGEVTMWAGSNGSGKSMVLSFCSLAWMKAGDRVAIASFEMKPLKLLERYSHQFSKGSQPSAEAVSHMFDWMHGRLWFYDQQGTVRPEQVFAVMRYAADKLKAQHFIVDSLMKCVRGEDDYNAQKDFVDELTTIARDTGMHVHMVHHVKKPSDEAARPSRYDAKGSGSISDQVDNALMVWRNRPKERIEERQDRGESLTARELEALDQPDVTIGVDKQRNGDWEGTIALWFHKAAKQYCADNRRFLLDFA